MDSIRIPTGKIIERVLSMEIVRVTERAAVSAASFRGQNNEVAPVLAAAKAMFSELEQLPIDGIIVASGEGERDSGPKLLDKGKIVGNADGFRVDIAADPLEGRSLCAHDLPGAVTVIAMAERDALLQAPDVYMNKIAVGPGYPRGVIDLEAPPQRNIVSLAKAKGVRPSEITAVILNRERHENLIAAVRATGAGVRLLRDGDIIGVLQTANPSETGVDIYLGIGGAAEGVLAAAALRCLGGQFQGRFIRDDTRHDISWGAIDIKKTYTIDEIVKGDCLFAVTGVTDGSLVRGVRFSPPDTIETETLVLRSKTGTERRIQTAHHHVRLKKFSLSPELERRFSFQSSKKK